ncbi:MAG: MFS transporter, partial [Calditrichaeota bacterium]|nr:MFS transporter [Calditrichota bacterium]
IDRSQHRRLLIVVALVGNALCFAAMALAPTFLSLMTARFIEGAMHITALTAWMATAADLSPRGRAGRIMGVLGGLIILGITIGVPLGGVVARHSVTAVLWFAALFSILAALLALPLRPVTSNIRERFRFREYYDHLRTHPELLIPYAYS